MVIFYKKVKLIFLNAVKLFIFLGSISSICFSQDSFEQIEMDLRAVQEKAIADIHKAFPSIPHNDWQNALIDINVARKKTRKLFFSNPTQTYYFQPKLDKKFTDQIFSNPLIGNNESSCLSNLKKEFSLNRWALLTHMCITYRNITPGTVTVESFSDEKGAFAYAKSGSSLYKWSLLNWCWKISEISKEQCIIINWQRLKKYFDAYSDQKYALFQIDTINHELTHLIEAHGLIHGLLLRIVQEYYPHINLDNHPEFINLQKAHELIAETVPRMLSLYSALLEEKRNYKAPSPIHPSSKELKPWIQRIVTCYENYYGKISAFNKKSFYKNLK